jgi:hypothetical protein
VTGYSERASVPVADAQRGCQRIRSAGRRLILAGMGDHARAADPGQTAGPGGNYLRPWPRRPGNRRQRQARDRRGLPPLVRYFFLNEWTVKNPSPVFGPEIVPVRIVRASNAVLALKLPS